MPSIEELRRWLTGEQVEGLPKNEDPDEPFHSGGKINKALMEDCPVCDGEGEVPVTLENIAGDALCPRCQGSGAVQRKHPRKSFEQRMKDKSPRSQRGGKYRLSGDGRDAILLFGKYKDMEMSQVAKTDEGRSYLQWMMNQGFPPELVDLAMKWHQREANKAAKR